MRLIDADELLEQIDKYMAMTLYGCSFRGGKIPPVMLEMRQAVLCDVEQLIYSTPTIDAAQVRRRGEWVFVIESVRPYKTEIEERCSLCGRYVRRYGTQPQDNFCPNCGADMRGETE